MAGNPHYEGDEKAIEHKTVNGKDVHLVHARGLNIVWGNDDRYWDVPKDDSRPAELLQVCWLEVTGSVKANPTKRYEVTFTISLTPDAFGWSGSPIFAMAKRGKNGKFVWRKDPLTNINGPTDTITMEVGPDPTSKDNMLFFGLYEVWSGKWKGGLRIHDVRIREL